MTTTSQLPDAGPSREVPGHFEKCVSSWSDARNKLSSPQTVIREEAETVIPAQAGIHVQQWISTCAGMTAVTLAETIG
jgi:hypothetical protein